MSRDDVNEQLARLSAVARVLDADDLRILTAIASRLYMGRADTEPAPPPEHTAPDDRDTEPGR